MYKFLKTKYTAIINKKIAARGLSLFRMFFSLVLLGELLHLFRFRAIVYGDGTLSFGEIDPTLIFVFWIIAVIFLFLGAFTRTVAIINYILSVAIFSSAHAFEYHVFYAYVGIGFLLMFMPVSRVLSVDSLIEKLKYSQIGHRWQPDSKVLAVNYLFPVFIGLGLVYADSILYKLSSPMWLNGLGVWLPATLPMQTWSNTISNLLNTEFSAKFMGYLVVVFEAVFIFLFWLKRFRIPILIIGILLHVGIMIEFPLPYFALTNLSLYILMVPVGCWAFLSRRVKLKKKLYRFYYDAECPLCNKTIVIIEHFDVFNTIECVTVQGNYQHEQAFHTIAEETLLINIHGVDKKGRVYVAYNAYPQLLKSMLYTYPLGVLLQIPGISFLGNKIYTYIAGKRLTERCTTESCPIPVFQAPMSETQDFLVRGFNKQKLTKRFWALLFVFFVAAQLLISWFSPLVQSVAKESGLNKIIGVPHKYLQNPLKKLFGITEHPVFMDTHFRGYNHVIKTVYLAPNGTSELVPLINENGMADRYLQGALWVNYTFRVSAAKLDQQQFEKNVMGYLRYFHHEKEYTDGQFIFYVKEINVPTQWQKDLLKSQYNNPWKIAGGYQNDKFWWKENMQSIFNAE